MLSAQGVLTMSTVSKSRPAPAIPKPKPQKPPKPKWEVLILEEDGTTRREKTHLPRREAETWARDFNKAATNPRRKAIARPQQIVYPPDPRAHEASVVLVNDSTGDVYGVIVSSDYRDYCITNLRDC
jgi:hypothetical protein